MATLTTTALKAVKTYSTGQTSDDFVQGAELAALMPDFEIRIPPALLDPNYVPENRAPMLLAVFLTSSIIAFITVALRIYSRLALKERRLLAEDYFVIVAMGLTIATTSVSCYGALKLQWGYRTWDLKMRSMEVTTVIVYVYQILGAWTLACVRVSLVLLIRRLYRQTGSRLIKVCNVLIVFLIAGSVGSSIAMIFQCYPVSAGYRMWERSRSSCNAVAIYYTNCILSTVSDAIVLALPLKLAWTLSTTWKKKVEVFALMGLGCLAWFACIARFWFLDAAVRRYDWWSIMNGIICSHLEVTITLSCSSGPALKAVYNKIMNSGGGHLETSRLARTIWPARRNIISKNILDSDLSTATTFVDKNTITAIKQGDTVKNLDFDLEKGIGRPIALHIRHGEVLPGRRISLGDEIKSPRTPRFQEDRSALGEDDEAESVYTEFEDDSRPPSAAAQHELPTEASHEKYALSFKMRISSAIIRAADDNTSNSQNKESPGQTDIDQLAPLSPRPQEMSQRHYIPGRKRRLTIVPEETDDATDK